MDLFSGQPFWMVKNGLAADFPALEDHLFNEEVVIIGSGITGALVAHELCKAGYRCTMLDKRMLTSGSTWASTAQMNYELDTPLHRLAERYDMGFAVAVYEASHQAVLDLQEVFSSQNLDAEMEERPVLYLAADRKGLDEIETEYEIRSRYGLPTGYMDRQKLLADYGIDRPGALHHRHGAQMDSYKAATELILHHVRRHELSVYTRTSVTNMQDEGAKVTLITDRGYRITARFVVCAAGYEAGDFLPEKVLDLHSTYALVTQPLGLEYMWKDRCLIWETARPYIYIRTTSDNRLMVGGQDLIFQNPKLRDALLPWQTRKLLQECHNLFPHIPARTEFSWCGTFSETTDGLPYIGQYPGMKNVYFALASGGNGTTYSMVAAGLIPNLMQGLPDHRQKLFGFERG